MSFEIHIEAPGESQRRANGDVEKVLAVSFAPAFDYEIHQYCNEKLIQEKGGYTIGTRPPQAKEEDLLAIKEPNSLEIESWKPRLVEAISATQCRNVLISQCVVAIVLAKTSKLGLYRGRSQHTECKITCCSLETCRTVRVQRLSVGTNIPITVHGDILRITREFEASGNRRTVHGHGPV